MLKQLVKLAFIAAVPGFAQTAAVPASPVTIPARFIPSQSISINVPKNGGKMSILIPAQILPAQASVTAPVTAPVKLGPVTLNFTCTAPPDADGVPDMQHLACAAAK